jgi:hypothetical protein
VIRVRGRTSLQGSSLTLPPDENAVDTLVVGDHLETYAAGDLLLDVGEEKFRVRLPETGAVDLLLDPSKDALPSPPEFDARVLFARPDGSALSRVNVHSTGMPTTGWTPWGAAGEMHTLGADSPHALKGPSRVVIDAEGMAILVGEVTRPGDTTLEWGRCGLWIEARDERGGAIEAVVLVDEEIYRTEGGVLSLEGLRPGGHRVVVSPRTKARSAKELRVVLADGQVKSRTVVLPAR